MDTVLGIIILGLVVSAFFFFGWIVGLVNLPLVFVYSLFSKPFASLIAQQMLGYPSSFGEKEFDPYQLADDLFNGKAEQRKIKEIQKIHKIAQLKKIADLLKNRSLKIEDFEDNFDFLKRMGFGESSWNIISDSWSLEKLIDLRDEGLSNMEVAMIIKKDFANK